MAVFLWQATLLHIGEDGHDLTWTIYAFGDERTVSLWPTLTLFHAVKSTITPATADKFRCQERFVPDCLLLSLRYLVDVHLVAFRLFRTLLGLWVGLYILAINDCDRLRFAQYPDSLWFARHHPLASFLAVPTVVW